MADRSTESVAVIRRKTSVVDTWQDSSACRGPNSSVFFPPTHYERRDEKLAREREAKTICGLCPVWRQCLQYALEIREQHGIWGGKTELERRRMLESVGLSMTGVSAHRAS